MPSNISFCLVSVMLVVSSSTAVAQPAPVGPPIELSTHPQSCEVLAAQPSGRYAVVWEENDLAAGHGAITSAVVDELDRATPPHELADPGQLVAYLQALRATTTGFTLEWYAGLGTGLRVQDLDLDGRPTGPDRLAPSAPMLSARPVGGYVATRWSHGRIEVQLLDRQGAPMSRPASIRERPILGWLVEQRSDGGFIVLYVKGAWPQSTWTAQWFDASGRLSGRPFSLARPGTAVYDQAVGANGTLAIITNEGNLRPYSAVWLRTFDVRGRARGGPTPLPDLPTELTLAVGPTGNVFVAWREFFATTATAREYTPGAMPTGDTFPVSDAPATTSIHESCLRAASAGRDWVVAWLSDDGAGNRALLSRRFAVP